MHAKKRKQAITGTGGTNKTAVFGMLNRETGDVRVQVVEATVAENLHPIIKKNVATGATLYADEHRGYAGLPAYNRAIIRHSVKEFVVGDCHTNGIESFWALFKRGYHGVYHQMSKKHLPRYLNEYAFRFSRRSRGMKQIFSDVVSRVAESKNLYYSVLTAKPA